VNERPLRHSAVLVPFYRDASGAPRLVFIRRSAGGVHGGQLAFPGGKLEAHDPSPWDTAVRESEEEIGLPRTAVTRVADLPVVETRTTGWRIDPFLARIARPAAWRPDAREVVEVLEPTLGELTDPARRGVAVERFEGYPTPIRFEFIRLGEHRLWGATLRIVDPLLPRLVAGEWAL
jgi:8-oxo-dGTP pyrophosphatase MutT (NUDIX family)